MNACKEAGRYTHEGRRDFYAHGVKQLLSNDLRTEAMGRLAHLHGQRESLAKLLARADVVICTAGAQGVIPPERVRRGQIVFALSTPDPEIDPATALAAGAAVAADGKSINNVLCFPGLFDAALRARARSFTDSMLVAAANALAAAAGTGQLLPQPPLHLLRSGPPRNWRGQEAGAARA